MPEKETIINQTQAEPDKAAIAAALVVLDRFMAALNGGDEPALLATLHFPHYRLAGGRMRVWDQPSSYLGDFRARAGVDWHHSEWDFREVIAAGPAKVHLDVQFTRYRADNSAIGSFRSLWIVTGAGGRWAVAARSSFAISGERSATGVREECGMKAIHCREWGTPDILRLEEAESPLLEPHQVRIRVRAAGVNFADTLMVAGGYQVKPPFPFTPGLEAAGEIVELGSAVDGLQMGQRVLAVLRFGGGYAEEIVLDAAAVVPIPAAMDFVTAAAFPVAYGTSHFALTHRGHLQPGETLLVLGAAGGVGLTAVEIGKAMGARVIAAAGGAEKLAVASSRGADELIDYTRESIRDRVRAATDGKGADVVYDPVGGDAFDQALRAVNWEARMLVIGFAAGRIQAVPANLILVKNISVIGVVWGAQAERDPALISRNLAELLCWWEAGRLKPLVAKVFSLAEAAAAMAALLSRRFAGKIVLET